MAVTEERKQEVGPERGRAADTVAVACDHRGPFSRQQHGFPGSTSPPAVSRFVEGAVLPELQIRDRPSERHVTCRRDWGPHLVSARQRSGRPDWDRDSAKRSCFRCTWEAEGARNHPVGTSAPR